MLAGPYQWFHSKNLLSDTYLEIHLEVQLKVQNQLYYCMQLARDGSAPFITLLRVRTSLKKMLNFS